MWLEEVTVDPAVLSWVQDLKTLHLHDVELKLPADRYYWHLPKLQTLFMSAVSVTASDDELISARPLFTPFTLPALTKLAWTWDEDNTGPELQLGHQLTHLFLHRTPITTASNPAPRYPALPDSLLPSLTSIQHLFFTIRYLSDIPPLGSIPSFLHSLHLSFFPGSERQVEPHLVQTGPKPRCLDQAAVLFIPPVRKQQMEHDEEGKAVEPEWRVKTRQWAGATSLYEVEMKMDAQDTMDTDAKRWLHHVSQVAWSPPATVTDPSKEDNTNSNLVVETNVAVRSDEEQKQPEGEVCEEGKEAGEPPRKDGVAQ